MRTYKLTIAYDGTNYQGWQRQSDTDRTIQGILEETLENCIGYQVQIDGSGRTDAGVHASGQTASVVLPGKVDTALFTEKMNGCLPPDIRILDVELVKKYKNEASGYICGKYNWEDVVNRTVEVYRGKKSCKEKLVENSSVASI